MATIIIAALVIVPLALLVGDLVRGKAREDHTGEPHATRLTRV